jgi:hypothetical protein
VSANPATLANIYSGEPRSPAWNDNMRAFRVFFFSFLIPVLVGCAGKPPTITSGQSASEFLYVGTSSAQFFKYGVALDGSLQPSALGSSIPQICWPQLDPVPGAIYALSTICPSTPLHSELRRFELDQTGNIVSSSGPLSLGPALPSSNGSPLTFVTSPDGKFAYVWSQTADNAQHVSPVQIGPGGQLTVKPDLGISFAAIDDISCRCGITHIPDAVIRTANGLVLSIQDLVVNSSEDGPHVSYSLYKLDDQTGGIVSRIDSAGLIFPLRNFFISYNGALILTGETEIGPESGRLQLFQLGVTGFTEITACVQDRPQAPACAHPDAGAFHPSGKWVFVADTKAGGVWTIPVFFGSSLDPGKASFVSANLPAGLRLVFSSTGKYLYVLQWDGVFASIQGFQIDQTTGGLTLLPGSPWPIGNVEQVTAAVDVAGKN